MIKSWSYAGGSYQHSINCVVVPPTRITPTLYHYEHELNSQIFLTIYFCTRFSATRNFASTFFASQNFVHLFRRMLFLCYQK